MPARPPTTTDAGDHAEGPPLLTRRRFLSGALAAAAAGGVAACTSGGDPAPTSAPTTTVATSSSQPAPGPSAPPTGGSGGGGGGGGGNAQVPQTAADETWNEPWVWRPRDWPGQALALNIVENQNPGAVVGFGNPGQVLFSYGGTTPGPTIRVRGDEDLRVTLRNVLGRDLGTTWVGPYPDPNELTGYVGDTPLDVGGAQDRADGLGNRRSDFCLGEHTNGVHTVHTTNLHTHGLHVRPGRNPDGTHSDNVILRLIPQADLAAREADPSDGQVDCRFLRAGDQINFLADDDQVGQADYSFRLGDVLGQPGAPHPPGTHWYHPHAHGATHDQVASGMAGFLVVEGDVDDAVRAALVPDRASDPGDPSLKTGPHDYRERLMLVQRVFNIPTDPDAPVDSLEAPPKSARSSATVINGSPAAATIFMRPNATERWRVLNGSVDGKGFRRLMVLRGRFGTNAAGHLVTVDADGKPGEVVTRAEVEQAKVDLHQLALDGITLVSPDGTYQIRDLAQQGDPDAPFPLDAWPTGDPAAMADEWAACFADGASLRTCYVRPNEVYLGPANRTDVFFQAPPLPDGQDQAAYSVIALGVVLHADTPLQGLQQVVSPPATRALDGSVSQPSVNPPAGPGDVVIATVTVTGEPAEPFDVSTIELPDVPPYLQPITDDDPALAAPDGGFRTRVVTYSGWGSQGMPLVTTDLAVDDDGAFTAEPADGPPPGDGSETAAAFAAFVRDNPDLEGLRWVRRHAEPVDGRVEVVLLAPNIRTMAIDGRKFDPTDPGRPRMHLDSAEEWVVQNLADGLWGPTGPDDLPPAQYKAHYDGRVMSLADGMARFGEDPAWQLLTRAVDHPFHIHQNPFWVTRIDVPDATGALHNILDQPRWMDVVPIPRHRGRVVFRSRFPDFVGTYVNHCHILLHEDNGMMQAVEVTPFDRAAEGADPTDEDVARANYVVRDALADPGTSPEAAAQVTDLYGRADGDQAWVANMTFDDPNESTGQSYPGFELTPPSS